MGSQCESRCICEGCGNVVGWHDEITKLLLDKWRMDFLEQHNATCNRIGFYTGTLRQAVDAAMEE